MFEFLFGCKLYERLAILIPRVDRQHDEPVVEVFL